MRVYLSCENDHAPPQDTAAPGIVTSVTAGMCPVCPGERLRGRAAAADATWALCPCCGAAWRLEDDGFAVLPGRLVEEWE